MKRVGFLSLPSSPLQSHSRKIVYHIGSQIGITISGKIQQREIVSYPPLLAPARPPGSQCPTSSQGLNEALFHGFLMNPSILYMSSERQIVTSIGHDLQFVHKVAYLSSLFLMKSHHLKYTDLSGSSRIDRAFSSIQLGTP